MPLLPIPQFLYLFLFGVFIFRWIGIHDVSEALEFVFIVIAVNDFRFELNRFDQILLSPKLNKIEHKLCELDLMPAFETEKLEGIFNFLFVYFEEEVFERFLIVYLLFDIDVFYRLAEIYSALAFCSSWFNISGVICTTKFFISLIEYTTIVSYNLPEESILT